MGPVSETWQHRQIKTGYLPPLAHGLALQDWTIWDIQRYFEHRLPPSLKHIGRPLANDLKQTFPAAAAPDARQILQYLKDSAATAPLFLYSKRTGTYPDMPTDPERFRPVPPLADLNLPALVTSDDLADWLGLTPPELIRFSDCLALSARSDSPFAPHFRPHLIPKKDGSLRLIEEPKPFLKHLQRRILKGILSHVPPHRDAFGFRMGRNCTQAAARHAGEEVVLGFDLRGFFPSIHVHRVYGLFRSFGYPAAVARHLSGLTTAVTPGKLLSTCGLANREQLTARHLPQGAPTSPALANLVAFTLDTRLSALARNLGASYTRYADDLSFSGDAWIARPLKRVVPDIVQDCGFTLNIAKTRVQPAYQRQSVTGIVVNRHLNLPRDQYDRLKAQVHHLRDPKDPRRADPAFLDQTAGRIAWLEQINPAKGAKLRERLAAALQMGENR